MAAFPTFFPKSIVSSLRALLILAGVALSLVSCSSSATQEKRILVFSKTAGFRHNSIQAGISALQRLGKEHHFVVDTTEDATLFNEDNLKRYAAVVFLNTTGDVLNPEQQNDFERFIQSGGGFVGVHAATDTEYGWPWYGKLVGAYFDSHPNNPNVQKGVFRVVDRKHLATDSLPDRWEREDEFYNFKQINPDIKVLVTIDEKTYQGGKNGDSHPMAWYHAYDGGRSFYTNMGHTDQSFTDPLFLKHLWGGLNYALGGEEPQALNYTLARTERLPEENRFTKVVLDQNLDEPTELVVFDDGRVLFLQRKGQVKLYSPVTQQTKVIAEIPVSIKYNPDKQGKQRDAEDGLLGVTLDPNFKQNHWLYIYLSPAGDKPVNTLCRFDMHGDEIDLASKKVVLEVNTQRDECCHTGGSLAFDDKGNLFLSTGDNTNPFTSNGYSPSDEAPGRSAWDAQRSSGNTNDLRGKILRIHPEPNGTYTIPEGNLFPKGTPNTRPEIYVMGNRNPYRISLDKKNNFLYWGEVGPDAGEDSVGRGPRGHDEVNQAKKPGFFGWPYFVGDNKAYVKYNFVTHQSGNKFEAGKPLNQSPNNTGMQALPPAQKAFIWYPYAESPEFPILGKGSRNAMAGPVFYTEDFKNAKRRFPDYYNGKLFIYDWVRGWIMTITTDKDGNLQKMEPFMSSTRFDHPIDMQFSQDGDLYILEYGSNWFSQNPDARLVKVEYNGGNRKPVVKLAADKTVGALPLAVNFSTKGTVDYDHNDLTYEWSIIPKGGGTQTKLTGPNPSFTFKQPGVFRALLTVKDTQGATATTETEIQAGNEPPQLSFDITSGNQTFFFPGQPFDYAVQVSDKEDGSLARGTIVPDQVAVTIDYLKEGFDQVEIVQGHRMADESVGFATGKKLIEESDCKGCHAIDKKSVGPAYQIVAQKYKGDPKAVDYLAKKIIKGGGGVWGDNVMSAHPQLTVDQTTDMVKYILSLAQVQAKRPASNLPTRGSYVANLPAGAGAKGVFVLRAAYTDKGANSLPPLTSEKVWVLKNPDVPATTADQKNGTQNFKIPDTPLELVVAMSSEAFIGFNQIDLSGINQLTFTAFSSKAQTIGGFIEVHLDSPTGPLLGQTAEVVPQEGAVPKPQIVAAKLVPTTGKHNVYLVFKKDKAPAGQPLMALLTVHFQYQGSGASPSKTAPKSSISMK